MSPVCICGGCGRTIEKDFIYCPWCGKSKISILQNQNNMNEVFEKLEELQINNHFERIKDMGERLEMLEKELDTLVLASEMHK